MNEPIGLEELERRLARDQAFMNQPAADWVPPRFDGDGRRILDVLIIGGGMCGLTAAFHLRRLGIHNIRIIDTAEAGREGPWLTFARMETLRSPKHLTGPASGLTNLTFRAWYEARNGEAAWEPLGYIPREMWAEYMAWFGHATGARVENQVRLEELSPAADGWRAQMTDMAGGETETVEARFVVLATGREALAVPRIPPPFDEYYGAGVVHTGDAPARETMHGRDVAVIGLGASAFDYAAEALEAGARSVKIIGRSERLARVNKAKQIVYAGFVHGYPLLQDQEKLALLEHIFENGIAPPRGTVQRVMRHANVELILAAPASGLQRNGAGQLELATTRGEHTADLIILGTGYRIDVTAAPFLSAVAPSIRTWRDALPADTPGSESLDFPYLGQDFEFLANGESMAAPLARLLCFNHAAMLSLGNLANDIPAVSEGADRLARSIAARLYLADKATHDSRLYAYEDPELRGDEIPGLDGWWPPLK